MDLDTNSVTNNSPPETVMLAAKTRRAREVDQPQQRSTLVLPWLFASRRDM